MGVVLWMKAFIEGLLTHGQIQAVQKNVVVVKEKDGYVFHVIKIVLKSMKDRVLEMRKGMSSFLILANT